MSDCDGIPSRNLKDNYDICGSILHPIINNAVDDKLKLAVIGPLHKGEDKTDKRIYRPISMLPAVSKILERIMESQLGSFVIKILFK